jgi:haloacetate dehalogenase
VFDDFHSEVVETTAAAIFVRRGGAGPPVLLLHGFPQTHLMWRDVASRLAQRFTVVCADLRGYGRSRCPAPASGHASYSKRAMALDMAEVMRSLGIDRFSVAGHDRGARVAHRLAADHPDLIASLAVLDIVPTEAAWARADDRFARAYWPWSLLSQPEPLPERLLAGAPDAVVDNALSQWGSRQAAFSPAVRDAYVSALADPVRIHAICEEYRAAATIDRVHDQADRQVGRRITCPLLVLWSAGGPLDSWYEAAGGPLALWQECAGNVTGHAVGGGHFFPEERPGETADRLMAFFARSADPPAASPP